MCYYNKRVSIDVLKGKTIENIVGLEKESGEVRIFTTDGCEYLFYHEQDCYESVTLNDFEVSAESLAGGLIVSAEEVDSEQFGKPVGCEESYTWTFYKIETNKGGLWMRWLGESNGYYSEAVNLTQVNKPN